MSCCWEKDKCCTGKIKRSKVNKHIFLLCSAFVRVQEEDCMGHFNRGVGDSLGEKKRMVRVLKSISCTDRLSNLLFNVWNAQKKRTGRMFDSYWPSKAAGIEKELSFLHGHSKQEDMGSVYQVFLVRYLKIVLLNVEIHCPGMCGIFITDLYGSY